MKKVESSEGQVYTKPEIIVVDLSELNSVMCCACSADDSNPYS